MFQSEYESLRNEMNENKKYVFERPLAIFTAAVILFDYLKDADIVLVLPSMIILLFLFNLDFTCNRLNSNARIVNYIRQFIESKYPDCYHWETFLHKYRDVNKNESLKFYPIIFGFHLIMLSVLALFQFTVWFQKEIFMSMDPFSIVLAIISIILFIFDVLYLIQICHKVTPKNVSKYFDEEIERVENTIKEL